MSWVVAALIGYVLIGVVSAWAGFAWFVAFAVVSIAGATLRATRDQEFWPTAHPDYSVFYWFPAIFAGISILFNHPLEWGQWLVWSLAISLGFVAFITFKFRRYIDRKWAVVATLFVTAPLIGFALNGVNVHFGEQSRQSHLATVTYASAGGFRQGGPRVSVSLSARENQTFSVDWETLRAAEEGAALCVAEYSGWLGWRWSSLAECTPAEIDRAMSERY